MKLLVLKKFNNYFNRIIKKYSTISDYVSAVDDGNFKYISDYNFNPNDGVRTEIILGKGDVSDFLDFEKTRSADYLVAYETQDVNNEAVDVIDSRWFITEVKRTRAGQFAVQLKRDSIADNLDTLLNCPAYIQKGICPEDSPLILNDENVSVNQIKTRQEVLTDKSGSAWIVGYMPKETGLSGHDITCSVPARDLDYITVEDLAEQYGVPASAIVEVLDGEQHTWLSNNGNIEAQAFINWVNNGQWEYEIRATTGDELKTFNWPGIRKYAFTSESPWPGSTLSETCFAKTPSTGVDTSQSHYFENKFSAVGGPLWCQALTQYASDMKTNFENILGFKFRTARLLKKLDDMMLHGTILKYNNVYYNISVDKTADTLQNTVVARSTAPIYSIFNRYISLWNATSESAAPNKLDGTGFTGKMRFYYWTSNVTVHLTEVPEASLKKTTFHMGTDRNACVDQVYDMFAIPYHNILIKNGLSTMHCDGSYAERLAVAIAGEAEKLDDDNPDVYALYDIQLLPYCPMPEIINKATGGIDITGLTENSDFNYIVESNPTITVDNVRTAGYRSFGGHDEAFLEVPTNVAEADFINSSVWVDAVTWEQDLIVPGTIGYTKTISGGKVVLTFYCQITDSSKADLVDFDYRYSYVSNTPANVSVVIYPKRATFHADIAKVLTLSDEMKIESICNNYRLVSPNYQGTFDFNLAKNRGSSTSMQADCTYKPYTPYIKVVPQFAWMYGSNFHDCRGLICGGDFSLGRTNSSWAQYQLNNKNYQNIFNREIQNLDVNQSIARVQNYAAGGINIVRDAAAGAGAGFMLGGGQYGAYGAAGGAGIGGAMSGLGLLADSLLLEKGLQEQRQFAIDKFNLQIGNIKAIPHTLTKVSSFDADSNIFPILEYYTCTAEEKEYLRNKFKYDGYTIGVVDTLGNYLLEGNYCQAYLIRNTEIVDDPHQLDDINTELLKGVYM